MPTHITMPFPKHLPVIVGQKEIEKYLFNLSQQVKNTVFIVISIITMIEYSLSRLVIPHLLNLYQDFGLITPKYFNAINIIIILGGGLAISLNYLPLLDQVKVNKLKEVYGDEIIITQNLVNPTLAKIVELYIKLSVLALLISIVYPIYNLTTSF